jgi:RNA polymerase sigma factor (sigma-70 family)
MDPASVHTTELHAWLERVQAGDQTARDDLLRGVADRLERLARKMLGRFPGVRRWADTGDVLQNACMRLLRALQEVRPASMRDFFGLAAEQMRRELLDLTRQVKRARRQEAVSADVPDSDGDVGAGDPAAGDHDRDLDLWERFHDGVQLLPAEEREVVSLIYYHGWSQPQVAELFQINERTVRRRWRSACMHLHDGQNGRRPDLAGEP